IWRRRTRPTLIAADTALLKFSSVYLKSVSTVVRSCALAELSSLQLVATSNKSQQFSAFDQAKAL
ncbi:MAG: hypothetical protein SGJ20_16325, partial [Planctomycetota bacterium]|nr:hypothetical protein [Planctomycetota bacterium]